MKYDVIIIGGGPGGSAAAKVLGTAGKKVALISKDLGGECLHYACIPTKTYLWSTELFGFIKNAPAFGIQGGEAAKLDWPAMRRRKQEIVEKLRKGLAFTLERAKVEIINGIGKVIDAHHVEVADKGVLECDYMILAAGSSPLMPPEYANLPNAVYSKEMLDISEVPKNLLIIGGGVIGVEMATLFSEVGSTVTIAEASERLLPREDSDISNEIERIFTRKGITVLKNTRVTTEQCSAYEKVLIAIGRASTVDPQLVQALGIQTTERGAVVTDDSMKTTVPSVFAIGDMAGKSMLAYTAEREGEIAAHAILGMNPHALNYQTVPNTIFSHPEIASVGMSQETAKSQNIETIVGKYPFSANPKAIIMSSTYGFVKIIADKKSRKILGIHIIGERASELVGEASLAVLLELTIDVFASSVRGHPILGEIMGSAIDSI